MRNNNYPNLFLRYLLFIIAVFGFVTMVMIQYTQGDNRLIVLATLIIAFIVIIILIYHLYENYVKPMRSSIEVTKQLANGKYHARTYIQPSGEAQQLSQAINLLAKNLQEMAIQEKMQGSQWKTVIDNMESGLMLIDERGYVHLINRKFKHLFGDQNGTYIGHLYYDVLPQTNIHQVVQETFLYEEKITNSVKIAIDGDAHYIEIVGAPVLTEKNEQNGVVLVFHDITELKRVEEMRKDFVANVSHELKTPITSIRGFAETILEDDFEDKAVAQQFVNIILKESTRLQALIHDLLELSKLEKEEMKLSQKRIDVDDWISGIITIAEQQAEQKSIHFESSIESGISFYGDPDHMQQVLLNLMNNAMSYTKENGEVSLSIRDEANDIVISVRDTGIGIPEEAVQRIFERFYRVDRARSRHTGGTGLGLAIVKHIVEAHNGRIHVESTLNEGSTFIIYIPKKL
ncbi:two-component sensor histidine kinase [Gracilibacillus halophilus YIM-C55.5]|uniref:histidine kinase n=1 Tax=Gracilibacillus halophilus YIM-C55.5 TaxID=1308866 RepID=N4WRS1_9BACI|nr:ATP-binding protein [Gracilibacillus halophilus]ENH97070.1 two-component sensor histidine kinase [Gracilibacillus halophilus YIM-C55.5]